MITFNSSEVIGKNMNIRSFEVGQKLQGKTEEILKRTVKVNENREENLKVNATEKIIKRKVKENLIQQF